MHFDGIFQKAVKLTSRCILSEFSPFWIQTLTWFHPCNIISITLILLSLNDYCVMFWVTSGARAVGFLLNVVITPFFLLSLAFRLYSIIFIVSKVTKNFFQNEVIKVKELPILSVCMKTFCRHIHLCSWVCVCFCVCVCACVCFITYVLIVWLSKQCVQVNMWAFFFYFVLILNCCYGCF